MPGIAAHAVRHALPRALGTAEWVQLLVPHKIRSARIEALSTIGWPQWLALVLLALLMLLLLLCRRLAALFVLLLVGCADGTSYRTNDSIRRPRPHAPELHVLRHINTDVSVPWGHVGHYTALCGFLLVLRMQARHRSLARVPMQVVLAAIIVLMGVSRVLEGEHWPRDILGGYLRGVFWLRAAFHRSHRVRVAGPNDVARQSVLRTAAATIIHAPCGRASVGDSGSPGGPWRWW